MTGPENKQWVKCKKKERKKKRKLTMVSTCLRARSLLGACLEKTERKRRSEPADLPKKKTKKPTMSCYVMLCHITSSPFQVTLSVILCPNVAWSRVELHLEMRGTIHNPSVQIFTQRDKLTCISQKQRESGPWNSLFYRAIYSYDQRQREGSSQQQEGGGGASG